PRLSPLFPYTTLFRSPKIFSERLAALRAAVRSSPAPGESTMLEKMRCIAGSMRFENGKIHDALFLGMPKLEHGTTLSRSSVLLRSEEHTSELQSRVDL